MAQPNANSSFPITLINNDREKSYMKKDILGKGTFGIVFRGSYRDEEVAVKRLELARLDAADDREVKLQIDLEHDNVLKILSVDEDEDYKYIFLELCAGTLSEVIANKYEGPSLPTHRESMYQIANGLEYMHSKKLIHRDIKPENILISVTGQLKLSDFGLCKSISTRDTCSMSGTKGTLLWMAPEMRGNDEIRKRSSASMSDIFPCGCVFFFLLTGGKHPFGDMNDHVQIHLNIRMGEPTNIKELKSDHFAAHILRKMIDLNPQNRISAKEIKNSLRKREIEAKRSSNFIKGQFKRIARLVREGRGNIASRFHPKKLVLACGAEDKIIFFSAENSFIPFSNWKEDEKKFQIGHIKDIRTVEWNLEGTQLATIFHYDVIVCWSYPSGEILFQKKLDDEKMTGIKWNPFRPNVFAAFIFFFNSCPVEQRPFHFFTIECEKWITSVQWISENRVALGFQDGEGIEIWEIDESTTSAKIVKRLEHKGVMGSISGMAWDERTKCLAASSWDGWIKIWSMDSNQPIHTTKFDGNCWSFAWCLNGKQRDDAGVDAARKSADNFILACGFGVGKIVIWTPLAKEKTRILCQHSESVMGLSFSSDARFLCSADIYKLIIWATENWEPVYIDVEEKIRVGRFSWFSLGSSSSSTNVPDYKLTRDTNDYKVCKWDIR
ncbi:uncharacterized protein LOC124313770 [Daphnia pulicaria]|uniref:uncharacterized protein LOC124313770 n=1 Tax=Daphnia pulicaria TaxID=35523 RepID=UPI001EEBC97B|nr:uncharacterized protein LOC124313770 [Daphnia pulicaria]